MPSQRVAARAVHSPAAQYLLERGRYRAVQVGVHVAADDRGAVGELRMHQAALVRAPAQAVHVEQAYGQPGYSAAERLGQVSDFAMDRIAQRLGQREAAGMNVDFHGGSSSVHLPGCRLILRATRNRINEKISSQDFEKT